MKKLIALCMVLAVSTTALCACSNGEEKTGDTDDTSSVSADSATEAEEATQEATEEVTEEYDPEERDIMVAEEFYKTIGEIDFYIPDAINYVDGSDWGSVNYWHTTYDYIFIGHLNDDTIYAMYDNYIGYEADIDSYDLEDVPEISAKHITDAVYIVFPHYQDKREITVESEETVTIGEKTYINQKGNMHLEFREPEDTRELSYTVYYTLDENIYSEKSPVSLLLFSDKCDSETETEMDRIAEESLSKTNWDL